ncbi:MAG: hypothetical protein ACREU8_00400 [Gammaproteobacteria bacterium]
MIPFPALPPFLCGPCASYRYSAGVRGGKKLWYCADYRGLAETRDSSYRNLPGRMTLTVEEMAGPTQGEDKRGSS